MWWNDDILMRGKQLAEGGDRLLHKERRGNRRMNKTYIHGDTKTSVENSAGMIGLCISKFRVTRSR
jgi:hypothetical protein